MRAVRARGIKTDVVAGLDQSYRALPISFFSYSDGTPAMMTFWRPSEEELAAIVAGEAIRVIVLGPPPIRPMSVLVGDSDTTPIGGWPT